MKKSVIGILAVAGMAATASAQTNEATFVTAMGTFYVRLVTDGTINAGLLPSVNNTLPDYAPLLTGNSVGQQASVGVTVQARFVRSVAAPVVAPPSVSGYFGIAGWANLSAANPSLIRAIDATGVTTVGRGRTGEAGLLQDFTTPYDAFGTYLAPFNRVGGAAFPATYRDGSAFNTDSINTTNANSNPAGFNLATNNLTSNGIVELVGGGNDGEIAGSTPTAARQITAGAQGSYVNINMASDLATNPYFNLYRFIVNPGAGNPLRDIFIRLNFQLIAFTLRSTAGSNWLFTFPTLGDTVIVDATLRIPTPGAAALVGLGGLLAARRRRAA